MLPYSRSYSAANDNILVKNAIFTPVAVKNWIFNDLYRRGNIIFTNSKIFTIISCNSAAIIISP